MAKKSSGGSKASGRKVSKASALVDVVDMKGNVIARVSKLQGKKGELKTRDVKRAAEQRLVEWRVSALDVDAHAWCAGMRVSYYAECLCYWNEVAMQLDAWGLDVRRVDVDLWCGAWRAWGRGVTQAKLVKKLFAAGYGKDGQTQAEARGKKDARTREQRQADVNALLGLATDADADADAS